MQPNSLHSDTDTASDDARQEEEITAAEKRGYSRGYQAGRKRQAVDRQLDRQRRQRRQDRLLLAGFAVAGLLAGQKVWTRGDKTYTTTTDYARLATMLVDELEPLL